MSSPADELHALLDDRDAEIARLRAALEPFARYAEMRAAKPFVGLGEEIHAIHTGTEWEAEITVSHVNAARAALAGQEEKP